MASNSWRRAPQARWFQGKTIDFVDWHPFDDGRGGTAHDPVIYFTDGSSLSFLAEETEVGEYGIRPIYTPAQVARS